MEATEQLVYEETRKILHAFSLAAFNFAKTEGINITQKEALLEYAKKFQERWRRENSGNSSYQQNEILKILKKIPEQPKVPTVSNRHQNIVSEDESEDWFENLCNEPKNINKTTVKHSEHHKNLQEISLELMGTNVESNIRFIEKIVTLCDEVDRKSQNFPSVLHKVLYDDAEHSSQLLHCKAAGVIKNTELSEDSGICCSEYFSEGSSVSEEAKPAAVVHELLRSKSANSIILDSLDFILDYIKTQLDVNIKEVTENWKDSLVEYACSVACKCSEKGAECEETVQNFIVDLIQEIWTDAQMNHHTKWSLQTSIIKNLLTTPPICHEVLYFTTDILDNVTMAIRRGCYTTLMIEKTPFFFQLYPITMRRLNALLKPASSKQYHEKIDVTKLWQERFSTVTSDNYHQDLVQGVKTDIIPKLNRLLVSTTNKGPMISLATKVALDELNNHSCETQMSQDSLKDMY